ncbi:MAG: Nif3-like dinuclear metal center hexameric protein [Bacteroidetes bacterium]|nr:Nif3-like dinuclear metal center hexameric protein [Bacteroidota bacterium]
MSLSVNDIVSVLEEWAPKWAAWEKDNAGLQVGSRRQSVKKVLISLDVTKQIINEAITKKADLIISHHPLLFRPPSSVTAGDAVGELILQLAEHRISVFSAHTNLDFTGGGVSFALAETLRLNNIRFLSPLKNTLSKIAVFIPEGHVDRVMQAMVKAGAGIIGKYASCSFGSKGIGSFISSQSSSPFIGKRNNLEFVNETRLEMTAPRGRLDQVITALKAVHPYEEVAYDIYNVENPNPNFGMGAIGTLPKPLPLGAFLKLVKQALGCRALRFTGKLSAKIQTVAVCGGSGSDLLPDAIASKADVFITADIKYHTFQTAAGRIALADAGHWETERVVLKNIAAKIRSIAKKNGASLSVLITKQNTNPIQTI